MTFYVFHDEQIKIAHIYFVYLEYTLKLHFKSS